MFDILVLPEIDSSTGLVDGGDLLAQDFLLALLNGEDQRPYLPTEMSTPLAKLLMLSGIAPPLVEVVMAFNLSMPVVKAKIIDNNPDYRGATLVEIGYTDTPGAIRMVIRLKTTTSTEYLTRTFQFESPNG
jgi:hypothetical protein